MLIRANPPEKGVCFAWLPKSTPDGLVWLEMVRYEFDGMLFDGGWRYTRFEPDWRRG